MFEDYITPNTYNKNCNKNHEDKHPQNNCPQLPGTILRINIPAGTTINLLNLLEVTSPGGICLIVRIPLLGGNNGLDLAGIVNSIKQAGGSVEFQ